MKLILRKNDSATSLLLFVYNNHYTNTLNDSLKLSSLLEIMAAFDKSETAIRMSLSRATKSGFLINYKQDNMVYYKLSTYGIEQIQLWNGGVGEFWRRYGMRFSDWNYKWHFILLQYTEKNKHYKAHINDALEALGFSQITPNAWISPYDQRNETKILINKYKLDPSIVELYGDMDGHMKTKDFLKHVYGIQKLKPLYNAFITKYEPKYNELVKTSVKDRTLSSASALPLLHELGWNFFKIAAIDATLPEALLPAWEGDRAAALMKNMREMLLPTVNAYLESV